MSNPRLQDALEALDRALAARPKRDGQAFSDATKPLSGYRDELRHELRAAPQSRVIRARLRAVNQAVTLLLAGHFPLGEMPWDQMEAVRDHLTALQRETVA